MLQLRESFCRHSHTHRQSFQFNSLTAMSCWIKMCVCVLPQEAFEEMFGGSRCPAPCWSLRTLIGLVLLAAAGVTLGALLSRR